MQNRVRLIDREQADSLGKRDTDYSVMSAGGGDQVSGGGIRGHSGDKW